MSKPAGGGSDSYSDVDLDLDLESVPVGKGSHEAEMELDDLDPVGIQEMDEDDEDDQAPTDGNRLAVLYDLLLTQEQITEGGDAWDFKGFIQEFADEEAESGIADELAVLTEAAKLGDAND